MGIGMRMITLVEDSPGNADCGYEHGLSLYVETERHRLLIDSGASEMFIDNARVLGVDLEQVDTVVLSHGHYDHGGGLKAFSEKNPDAAIYVRPSAAAEYYHLKSDGEKYIGIDKDILRLPQVVIADREMAVDEELFLFSDITGSKYPSKGNRELKRREGGVFVQDSFDHEQCLVVTQGDRRTLLSGCAHNGIFNILDRYRELFGGMPDIVVSGFHLMQREDYTNEDIKMIESIAEALAETGAIFYTGHCTGQAAYGIMKPIMGERLRPIHSGDVLME
ncbi:MBL fold metallo-hydrolase [Lachnospiraceae bacterium JLR.KK008]